MAPSRVMDKVLELGRLPNLEWPPRRYALHDLIAPVSFHSSRGTGKTEGVFAPRAGENVFRGSAQVSSHCYVRREGCALS